MTDRDRTNSNLGPAPFAAIRDARSDVAFLPWLHRFCLLTLGCTFVLLIAGGTVTSKGVGMAVPDWPTTYGYNMFLYPPRMWVGGVFWEHVHRLMGSLVGVLTIVLAIWLAVSQQRRPWLRWLGGAALLLVSVQGIIGGMRVVHNDYRWGIVHGITAQLFFCLIVLITAATGRVWIETVKARSRNHHLPGLAPAARSLRLVRILSLAMLGVMVVQLSLGALMRHSKAGLAIHDFPTAYGQIIPPLTHEGIRAAVDALPYYEHGTYYTPFQVGVHFAHRVWACVVVVMIVSLLLKLAPAIKREAMLTAPAIAVLALLVVQIALGALVIWTGQQPTPHPEMATSHQACGAALLACSAWLVIRIHLLPATSMLCDAHEVTLPGSVRLEGSQS